MVEDFTYLGSVISNDATTTKDVDNRLAKANSSFGRLQKRVWKNHSLRLPTKIMVYEAVVISTLLFGCEAWVLYRKQIKLLERFHQRCLRSILKIRWQDRVTNNTVLERSNMTSIEAILLSRQLRWVGHVCRMDNSRLPKAIFYGELREGKRKTGCPRKRFKDQTKRHLIAAGIPISEWQRLALDRERWRGATRTGSEAFERARRAAAEEKRTRRRAAQQQQPMDDPTQGFVCPHCGKVCRARIGLYSHLRACRRLP